MSLLLLFAGADGAGSPEPVAPAAPAPSGYPPFRLPDRQVAPPVSVTLRVVLSAPTVRGAIAVSDDDLVLEAMFGDTE